MAGTKALVTMNTLIFEGELKRVALMIERIAEAGVDALIVQGSRVAPRRREIALVGEHTCEHSNDNL